MTSKPALSHPRRPSARLDRRGGEARTSHASRSAPRAPRCVEAWTCPCFPAWALSGAQTRVRDRPRHASVGDREALCLVSLYRAAQPDLGREAAELAHTALGESGGDDPADGGHQPRAQRSRRPPASSRFSSIACSATACCIVKARRPTTTASSDRASCVGSASARRRWASTWSTRRPDSLRRDVFSGAATGRSLRVCPRCHEGQMRLVECLVSIPRRPAILDSS